MGSDLFAERMLDHGDRELAAREAGYRAPGRVVERNPGNMRAMREAFFRRAVMAGHEALRRLEARAIDPATPAGVAVSADRALVREAARILDGSHSLHKEPHEMTADELAAELRRLELVRADQAGRLRDVDDGVFD